MTRVRVDSFTISLDGYGGGPNQDIADPLGVGGGDLAQWLTPPRTFQRTVFGKGGGTTGLDDDFAAAVCRARSSSIFVLASATNCTSRSHRCCWVVESGCSKGSMRGLQDSPSATGTP